MKTYPSKVDKWAWIMVALVIASFAVPSIIIGSWWWALAGIPFGAYILYALLSIRYTIHGDTLTVQDCFKSVDYPIANIKSVQKTWSILASPASSFDRIAIKFDPKKRPATFFQYEISPRDRDAFIADLLAVNPAIQVLPAKK